MQLVGSTPDLGFQGPEGMLRIAADQLIYSTLELGQLQKLGDWGPVVGFHWDRRAQTQLNYTSRVRFPTVTFTYASILQTLP